jgi:DNA-directed RNA polymerase specialized sigma24 family protein
VDALELALKNNTYLRLCKHVLCKHGIPASEHEDRTVQAIWKTFKRHDDRIGQFTSSLYRYITWECLLYLKERRKLEQRHVRISDKLVDPRSLECDKDKEASSEPVGDLEPIHRDILQQFYLAGASKTSIRKELGMEKDEFNTLFQEALQKLKNIYKHKLVEN